MNRKHHPDVGIHLRGTKVGLVAAFNEPQPCAMPARRSSFPRSHFPWRHTRSPDSRPLPRRAPIRRVCSGLRLKKSMCVIEDRHAGIIRQRMAGINPTTTSVYFVPGNPKSRGNASGTDRRYAEGKGIATCCVNCSRFARIRATQRAASAGPLAGWPPRWPSAPRPRYPSRQCTHHQLRLRRPDPGALSFNEGDVAVLLSGDFRIQDDWQIGDQCFGNCSRAGLGHDDVCRAHEVGHVPCKNRR